MPPPAPSAGAAFKVKKKGKIVPHGIYDPAANAGWVSLGITHDTAEFAVEPTIAH